MDTNTQLIFDNLRRIQTEGGNGNFVIFQFSSQIYIQFAGGRGDANLIAEAVSNEVLKSPYRLNREQIARMVELGWTAPDENESNFYQNLNVQNDDERLEIARFVVKTAEQVYGMPPSTKIEVELNLE
jgi:hypothetical protein